MSRAQVRKLEGEVGTKQKEIEDLLGAGHLLVRGEGGGREGGGREGLRTERGREGWQGEKREREGRREGGGKERRREEIRVKEMIWDIWTIDYSIYSDTHTHTLHAV